LKHAILRKNILRNINLKLQIDMSIKQIITYYMMLEQSIIVQHSTIQHSICYAKSIVTLSIAHLI